MEAAGLSPNTVRTEWIIMRALFARLVTSGTVETSQVAFLSQSVDSARNRVYEVVVPNFVPRPALQDAQNSRGHRGLDYELCWVPEVAARRSLV